MQGRRRRRMVLATGEGIGMPLLIRRYDRAALLARPMV